MTGQSLYKYKILVIQKTLIKRRELFEENNVEKHML